MALATLDLLAAGDRAGHILIFASMNDTAMLCMHVPIVALASGKHRFPMREFPSLHVGNIIRTKALGKAYYYTKGFHMAYTDVPPYFTPLATVEYGTITSGLCGSISLSSVTEEEVLTSGYFGHIWDCNIRMRQPPPETMDEVQEDLATDRWDMI